MKMGFDVEDVKRAYKITADEHDFRFIVIDYLAELRRMVRDTQLPDTDQDRLRAHITRELKALDDVIELVLYDLK